VIADIASRWRLAQSDGGATATLYWLASRLVRLDAHKFYAIEIDYGHAAACEALPDGNTLLCIDSVGQLEECSAEIVETLDRQNGVAVRDSVANGGRVYAITCGEAVVAQLRVEFGRSNIDSPFPMALHFGERDAFFSYLYTWPPARGAGWATKLIRIVSSELAAEGWSRCLCHIRATNVPSIATFRRCGWRPVALLWSNKWMRWSVLQRLSEGHRLRLWATRM